MQNLDVISVNIWQILISVINLFLLFLILKKFLYKPVRNFVAKREAEVNKNLSVAEEIKKEAEIIKSDYEEKMSSARIESDAILDKANMNAKRKSDEIITDAKDTAQKIIEKAKEQAELEKRKAKEEMKEEIVVLSGELTEKLLEREISTKDNEELINSFLEQVGNK